MTAKDKCDQGGVNTSRRDLLLGCSTLAAATAVLAGVPTTGARAQAPQPAAGGAGGSKPNILVIWGDDIGQGNISAYTKGVMGYRTPNIDRIANEGMIFTDYYGEQSCTAGRSTLHGCATAPHRIPAPLPSDTSPAAIGVSDRRRSVRSADVPAVHSQSKLSAKLWSTQTLSTRRWQLWCEQSRHQIMANWLGD
jgi:hypothetical protein